MTATHDPTRDTAGDGPRLRLMGAVRLVDTDGRDITPRGAKAQALLARLAMARGRSLSRSELADDLWRNTEDPSQNLRQAVRQVRDAIGADRLLNAPDGRLQLGPDLERWWVDAWELERLAASEAPVPEAVAALYEGPFLEGLSFPDEEIESWTHSERSRLRNLARRAVEGSLEWAANGGDKGLARRAAGELLRIDPAHEGAHRALMRLHAEVGDRFAVDRQYEACRVACRQLGANLSSETEALHVRIRRGRLVPDGPPGRTRGRAAASLDSAEWRRAELLRCLASNDLERVPDLRRRLYESLGPAFEPRDAALHDGLSRALLDLGRYREAIVEVHHTLKLGGFSAERLFRRALAATGLHELATAQDALDELAGRDPAFGASAEVAGLQGRIHRERHAATLDLRHLRAALEAYTRGMEADPSDFYCAVNAGSLALQAGDHAAAKRALSQAQETAQHARGHGPAPYWADFTVAEVLLARGDVAGAIEEYERGRCGPLAPPPRAREAVLRGALRLMALRGWDEPVVRRLRGALA